MADQPRAGEAQVRQIRAWLAAELHPDHDTFAMGRDFAQAVLDHFDYEISAYQVDDGYQKGHEHGSNAMMQVLLRWPIEKRMEAMGMQPARWPWWEQVAWVEKETTDG